MPTDLASWATLVTSLVREWGWWGALAVVFVVAAVAAAWVLRHHQRQTVILLRETYINLIQNGPANFPPAQQPTRVKENVVWWESEAVKALRWTGASKGEVSRFKMIGNLNRGNYIADKLDALEAIIRRWDGRQ
jgi:hypothetical protein